MGVNHARVIAAHPGTVLACVADPDAGRGRAVAERAEAAWVPEYTALVGRIDAAVVAVPTRLHQEVASTLIDAGVPVLLEKPIAASSREALELVLAAERRGVVLAVGHVERFNPAVLELDDVVSDPIHLEFRRFSPFTPRIEESVVRDLMIHDIDLALSLAGAEPVEAMALAVRDRSATDDLASALLRFANGVVATLTASRIGQEKIRHIDITQRENHVHVDLVRQDVTIHRRTQSEFVTVGGARYAEAGVIEIPYLRHRGEPLALEFEDFAAAVCGGGRPRVSGRDGMRVLEIAERIEASAVRSEAAH